MKEARDVLKFEVKELWADTLYFNSCRVEAEIQKYYTHERMIGLPSAFNGGQLWRVCGAGGVGAYKKWDTEVPEKVVRVFIAYSDHVKPFIASGRVIYNA